MKKVTEDRRLVVVDDSIVRGNAQRALVTILQEAGAVGVHIRISSPSVTWPYFLRIDFPTRGELIANPMGVEEVCNDVGADTLEYISLDGMVQATKRVRKGLYAAYFTGGCPMDITSVAAFSGSDLLDKPAGICNPSERQ